METTTTNVDPNDRTNANTICRPPSQRALPKKLPDPIRRTPHRPQRPANASTNATGCADEQEQSRNGARVGMPGTTSGGEVGSSDFAVEDLLYEYGVDLAFFGYVHDYARFLPSYNDTVLNEEFAEAL